MKRYSLFTLIVASTTLLTSCEVIGGIFKAGVWVGGIVVVAVIALVIWILVKIMGGRRN